MKQIPFALFLFLSVLTGCASRRYAFRETIRVAEKTVHDRKPLLLSSSVSEQVDTFIATEDYPVFDITQVKKDSICGEVEAQQKLPGPGSEQRKKMFEAGRVIEGIGIALTVVGSAVAALNFFSNNFAFSSSFFDPGNLLLYFILTGIIMIVAGLLMKSRSRVKPPRNELPEPGKKRYAYATVWFIAGTLLLIPFLIFLIFVFLFWLLLGLNIFPAFPVWIMITAYLGLLCLAIGTIIYPKTSGKKK